MCRRSSRALGGLLAPPGLVQIGGRASPPAKEGLPGACPARTPSAPSTSTGKAVPMVCVRCVVQVVLPSLPPAAFGPHSLPVPVLLDLRPLGHGLPILRTQSPKEAQQVGGLRSTAKTRSVGRTAHSGGSIPGSLRTRNNGCTGTRFTGPYCLSAKRPLTSSRLSHVRQEAASA